MEVSLVSGGIDSTLGYRLFASNTIPVFIDYGHRYSKSEKSTLLELFNNNLIVIDVKSKYQSSDIFVPNRNLTFVSLCVMMLPSVSKINIFGVGDDNCADKNNLAYGKMGELISSFSGRRITVVSPTQHLFKSELIKQYISTFGNVLPKTFSCYSSADSECMDCPACLRKHVALFENGIPPKTILKNSILDQYLSRTDISEKRIEQIKKYKAQCLTSNL
jgi:7-cyano-7-deazaguanine synthase in queuosine biosynthesis